MGVSVHNMAFQTRYLYMYRKAKFNTTWGKRNKESMEGWRRKKV
jgi:hypothetical protein